MCVCSRSVSAIHPCVCVCVRANVCVVRACFNPQRRRSSTRGGCWLSPASAWRCWWSASSAWWPTAKPSTCLEASKWTAVMGEGGNEWIRLIFASLKSVGGHVTPVKWKCKIIKREIYDTKSSRATRTGSDQEFLVGTRMRHTSGGSVHYACSHFPWICQSSSASASSGRCSLITSCLWLEETAFFWSLC